MRRYVTSFLVVALLGAAPLFAQSKAKATNVPEIPFDSVANFFKLPADQYFGEGIGVATNSKGHVFVYTRSGDTKILEFDQNGAYVREIGQGLYGLEFAHAIRVDPQDNIWAVDEMSNMVMKFDPEGRVAMLLGRKAESEFIPPRAPGGDGAGQPTDLFNRPTDVAWDASGNIFVADGAGNGESPSSTRTANS